MMDRKELAERLRERSPRVHCLTNPVTMQDMANLLLAAGGSAIMAQSPEEAAEITEICHATLLNTGVPDQEKWEACILAGRRAAKLAHPVVLDPVGAGASRFRRSGIQRLLSEIRPSIIRCNQEEAYILLGMRGEVSTREAGIRSGGVESGIAVSEQEQRHLAGRLAQAYDCAALVSGEVDVVSDGRGFELLHGGDQRMARITGSGCMLSALCALFAGAGLPPYEAACEAGALWKESSELAGSRTDREYGGIGSFHRHLFDALEECCSGRKVEQE
ncbi:MAG: hydroxyethylthiazole kinase [Clostridiales bacterium]|nr:hydroxyethylthiazole kinase [Clostridiales bacterium]